MATITFTLDELLGVIQSNDLLPPQITKTEIKDGSIHCVVKTEAFLLPFIPASLKYVSYENNTVTFELNIVGGHFNKALGFFSKSIESKIPDFVKLELPNVLIDLEILFKQKNIKGFHIKEIEHDSDSFTITAETI